MGRGIVALVFGTAFLPWAVAWLGISSNRGPDDRLVLKKIQRFVVTTEVTGNPDLLARFLSEQELQTIAELKLRSLGIKVIDEKSRRMADPNFDPSLSLNVTLVGSPNSYSVSYRVYVYDSIKVIRTGYATLGKTWQDGGLLTGPAVGMKTHAKEALDEALNGFCNDYLAVNPK